MAGNERLLSLDNFVDARVGREDSLNIGEGDDRAVSATNISTAKQAVRLLKQSDQYRYLRLVTDGD